MTAPGWPGLMTVTTAAAYLDMSERSFRKIVAAKDISAVTPLGSPRYARADLDAYIARLRRTA